MNMDLPTTNNQPTNNKQLDSKRNYVNLLHHKTPEIIYFTADKININKGESVKLQWEMTNVIHPYLTTTTNSACVNADCFNDPKDSAVVSPYTTTTYILSSGIKGSGISKQITVTVK